MGSGNSDGTLAPIISRSASLKSRVSSTVDATSADRLDVRLQALADKAHELARRIRSGDRVRDREFISEPSLGDLADAAKGWAGCSQDVAQRCLTALAAYDAAMRALSENSNDPPAS